MPAPDEFNRALACHQAGDLAAAESGYRRILARAPRDVMALYHLGVVLHQQGRKEEASRILADTLAVAPDYPEARLSLGVVLMDLGRNGEAEAELRQAIALNPGLHRALLRLGELLVLEKRYAESLPVLRKAVQLRENDKKAWASLAIALRQLEQLEEGIAVNRRVLDLDGADDDNHTRMADLIYLLNRRNPELARQHARWWLAAFPGNAFAQHIGSAVLGLAAPERASDGYVRKLFDNFADSFEERLTKIGYHASDMIAELAGLDALLIRHESNSNTVRPEPVEGHESARISTSSTRTDSYSIRAGSIDGGLAILDAGCGTGLAAARLRPAAGRLTGVDISPRMLEQARGKGLYDELAEMELGAFLQSRPASFDLIVACDVFIYFGDLAPVMGDAARALRPGGRLAFSVECGDAASSFVLGPHGRYSHAREYVAGVLERSGLKQLKMQETVLRYEFGKAVNALLALAGKPA